MKKPARFDRNLIVIGAGSAGLVTAYIAAAVNAKVTLIEKHQMGGDCLNTGCVPSKALIQTARFLAQINQAKELGIHTVKAEFNFADIMQRVHRVIKTIEPHDSVERFTGLGVECLQGEAVIESPWHVSVNGQTLSTRSIVVATGANPVIPPISGIGNVPYLTSNTLWDLQELPQRLLVLGGGPIGCELSQCFARFGSEVTQLEMQERLLTGEDVDVSKALHTSFVQEGIDLKLSHRAQNVEKTTDGYQMLAQHNDKTVQIPFDAMLVAVGRKPEMIPGLQELGVKLNKNGTIAVDQYLRSSIPSIYACGDVAGPFQLTHAASHQAWYCAVNTLFPMKKFAVDYSVIPKATFTEPEIASVGLNEQQAQTHNIDYEISRYDLSELDRAIADNHANGFIKVLTKPGKDTILGATVVGDHAGELITEYVSAMKHGIGLNKILGTIHIYPTLSEANKYVAGVWKKNHSPQWALHVLKKYHNWMR